MASFTFGWHLDRLCFDFNGFRFGLRSLRFSLSCACYLHLTLTSALLPLSPLLAPPSVMPRSYTPIGI